MARVAVIGAGIIGLSTAVEILQDDSLKCKVTLIADKFTPNTTSDVAAGLWTPYLSTGKVDRDREWAGVTYKYMEDVFFSPSSQSQGICQTSGYYLLEYIPEPSDYPFWKDIVQGFRVITENEAKRFGDAYKSGYFYTSYTLNSEVHLQYLLQKFRRLGGISHYQRVDNIENLAMDFDVIINCTGIEASKLVADPKLYPIRGQVFQVKAPWIKQFMLTQAKESSTYIIPRGEDVILGGTAQINNWNLDISDEDSKRIWQDCIKMMPSLANATVIRERVGLRPARTDDTRLEVEKVKIPYKDLWVIHNYGHSGSGITYSKGVAVEATRILKTLPIIIQTSHL